MIRFSFPVGAAADSPDFEFGDEPLPDGAEESPPQPINVPNRIKLADKRSTAKRPRRMTGLLRREAGKGRTISVGDREFKVGCQAIDVAASLPRGSDVHANAAVSMRR